MRDTLMILLTAFWTLAYVFAVVYAVKNKEHAIPVFAVSLNFSWEIVAFFKYYEYVDIAWIIVDIVIVVLIVIEFAKKHYWKGLFYLIPFFLYGLLCIAIFDKPMPDGSTGYIFLSFAMDLVMAINFHYELPKKNTVDLWLICVAIFKLLGDAFAAIIYREYTIDLLLGVAVLVINGYYVYKLVIRMHNYTHNVQPYTKNGKKKKRKKR